MALNTSKCNHLTPMRFKGLSRQLRQVMWVNYNNGAILKRDMVICFISSSLNQNDLDQITFHSVLSGCSHSVMIDHLMQIILVQNSI